MPTTGRREPNGGMVPLVLIFHCKTFWHIAASNPPQILDSVMVHSKLGMEMGAGTIVTILKLT